MQNVSELYRTILSGRHIVESKIDIYSANGATLVHSFGESDIVSMTTSRRLFAEDTPSIGGAVANEINVELFDGDVTIPRMAMLRPYVRVRNETQTSEWIPKGVYWLDTRKRNYQTGMLTIHGYDAMLKAERMNTLNSTSSSSLLTRICQDMGVQLDSRTQAASVTISTPTQYTDREILQFIAVVSAGNWIITDEGKLLLIGLNSLPQETFVLVDNIGNAITFGGDRILTEVV